MRCALHVILASQRIYPCARLADISGNQREIDQPHHALGSLHMFGYTKSMCTIGWALACINTGCRPDVLSGDFAYFGGAFRRPVRDIFGISVKILDTSRDKIRVMQLFRYYDVRDRILQRDIGSRFEREMDGGNFGKPGPARVDHYQLAAPAQNLLPDARANYRMAFQRIGASDQNRRRALDVIETVGRCPGTQYRLHRSRRWRVTYPRTAIYIVGADHHPGKFLGEIAVFIGRAG